jgi:O-antigen/teichoic acid export membrane protein
MDERVQGQGLPHSSQQMTAAVLPPDDLRAKVVGGLGWKLATQIVTQGTRTVVAILLAHLLSPHDYGLAAMALVFTALAPLFTDLSLGAALVQRPVITEADRSTAFWTTVAASMATTGVGIAGAPLIADFFGAPAVAPLVAVASITFTLSGLSATQFALLNRELRFRSLQVREMVAIVVASVVGLAVAFAGGGPWAIVVQLLVADGISSLLVWRFCRWRPSLTYSLASLRELGSFGAKALGARFLSYLRLNADNLLVGRYLGSGALGIYAVAYNVMFAPVTRITQPIQQVLFPAFARLQVDPARLSGAWLRGNRLVAALTIPAFLGIAVIAPDFVPVVLGRRWHHVVPVLQLLSLTGVVMSIEQLNASVLQAMGRPGTLFKYMFSSTALIVAAFALGVHWGVVGVAALYLVAVAGLAPFYAWVTLRALGISVTQFARSLAGIVEASLAMALLVYGARLLLVHEGVPPGARVGLLIPLGAAAYLAYVAWRARDLLEEARSLRARAAPSPESEPGSHAR